MDESQTPPTPEQPQEPTPAPEPEQTSPNEAPAEVPAQSTAPTPFNPFTAGPADPEAPIGAPMSPDTSVPTPPKKSPKKLLIIIGSIVGGLIILAAIAVAIYLLFFAVTTKDYQTALTTSNAVVAKAEASEGTLTDLATVSSGTSTSEINKQITSAQSALSDFKKSNGALANLKALHDKDVKAKYNAYITKYNAYVTYVANFLASYKQLSPAFDAISKLSGDTDLGAAVTDLQTAQKAFAGAKNAPDKDFATYATSVSSAMQDAVTAAQKAQAAQTSRDEDAYFDAIDDYDAATGKLTDAADTFDTNISNHADAVDPSTAYNAFIDAINNKIK